MVCGAKPAIARTLGTGWALRLAVPGAQTTPVVASRGRPGTASPVPASLGVGARPPKPPGWQLRRQGRCPLTAQLPVGHDDLPMLCPKCAVENPLDATRCSSCGDSLSVAVLEVIRGEVPEKIRFLKPRPYSVGRARHNDIAINEPSISKLHARFDYQDGHFFVEDAGSLHGVYVNAAKIRRAELVPGRADPAGQRDAEVLAPRLGERDRRHGQAALGRAAAAPALPRPDPELDARAEPGPRAGARRDHAHHGRRAGLSPARRRLVPRRALPRGGRPPAPRRPRPHGRGRGQRARHLRRHRAARAGDGRGGLDRSLAGGGGRGSSRRPAAPTRTRGPSRPSCACPCAPPAPGPTGPAPFPAPWAFSTSTTPAPPSRSAATPCARPRPWPDTPPSPSRTPSSSSGSSTRSRSCRRPRSSCCSRRSWRPSARWRPASPTS